VAPVGLLLARREHISLTELAAEEERAELSGNRDIGIGQSGNREIEKSKT